MTGRGRDIRIVRTASGENAAAWQDALARFDPDAATVLKEDISTGVYRATLRGRDVAVKRWDLGGRSALWKARLRLGRADRHWRGATWLAARGFSTAAPLVLATEAGRPKRQWLVMDWLSGKSVLEHLAEADLSVPEEHALARTCGALAMRLFCGNRFNRDGKPSNLIVTRTGLSPEIAVIDCVAIQRIVLGRNQLKRMLASLYIEPLGCGCRPRRALAMAALHGAWGALRAPLSRSLMKRLIHGTWQDVAEIVASQGDPRPAVDPLAIRPGKTGAAQPTAHRGK